MRRVSAIAYLHKDCTNDISTISIFDQCGRSTASSGKFCSNFFRRFASYCTVAEACNGQDALDLMNSGQVAPDVVGEWV